MCNNTGLYVGIFTIDKNLLIDFAHQNKHVRVCVSVHMCIIHK